MVLKYVLRGTFRIIGTAIVTVIGAVTTITAEQLPLLGMDNHLTDAMFMRAKKRSLIPEALLFVSFKTLANVHLIVKFQIHGVPHSIKCLTAVCTKHLTEFKLIGCIVN